MMLTREQARQEVRARWKEFGQLDRTGKGIICPICDNGRGRDGDGITENPRRPGQLKCWKCGFTGDAIDLFRQQYEVDYNEALQSCADFLGITIEPYSGTSAADDFKTVANDRAGALQNFSNNKADKIPTGQPQTPQAGAGTATAGQIADYTDYYRQCAQRLDDPAALSYLEARGISRQTAAAYNLGYDPAWISPEAIRRQRAKGSDWTPPATARLIMPVSKNHYVARAISPGVTKYAKQNETGGGSVAIFNLPAIRQGQAVFIMEGIINALSVIEAGGQAIALNSTSNAEKLIEQLEKQQAACSFVICTDNDDAGRRAAETLESGLQRLKLKYITANISGDHNDANDALIADRQAFEQAVKDAQAKAEAAQAGALPGLLVYDELVREFQEADDEIIEIRQFPEFSKTAKIKKHSTIAIAADTGGGKSSLAINFLNALNTEYPCMYFNLEMDRISVLRRIVAIHSGLEIDRIEGYKNDARTAEAVNIFLKAITERQPLQVIQDVYTLEKIEKIIKASIEGRDRPTMVFVDHSLLVEVDARTAGRYERFTIISEQLRKIALKYNIVLFVLLQQNRAGKADEEEKPKNSSLKESGSWENDATHICFLWFDPKTKRKKLLLTKNRGGDQGEFTLNYWKKTQTYTEAKDQAQAHTSSAGTAQRITKRDKARGRLQDAYNDAVIATNGKPTLRAMAEAADVTTATVKGWIKEYGGCTVDGQEVDPAGLDTTVEYTGFVKLTPADDIFFNGTDTGGDDKTKIAARF